MSKLFLFSAAFFATVTKMGLRYLIHRGHQKRTNTVVSLRKSSDDLDMHLESHVDSQGELVILFQATQPFYLLSRGQVHQLYNMLNDAQKNARHTYSPSSPNDIEHEIEKTAETLQQKIRFVRRSPQHLYPAILGLEKLQTNLTYDELEMLDIQVTMLRQDLDVIDADGYLAEPPTLQGVCHLLAKGAYDRHGLALCGSPPPVREDSVPFKGWFLFPFVGDPPQKHPLCGACLQRWNATSCQGSRNVKAIKPENEQEPQDPWYDQLVSQAL